MESVITRYAPSPDAMDAVHGPDCFHCGLPVPDGLDLEVTIDDAARPMCCQGCAAVAQAILRDNGIHDVSVEPVAGSPRSERSVEKIAREDRLWRSPEGSFSGGPRKGARMLRFGNASFVHRGFPQAVYDSLETSKISYLASI